MKSKFFFFVFCGFLVYHTSSAQSNLTSAYPVLFSDMEEVININSHWQEANTTGSEQIQSSNTGVYLEQIGDRNSATANISSRETSLQLIQRGNDNFLGVRATAKTVEGNLVQNGDNNFAFDFADDPTLPLSLNLSQDGDGHHFESHGTNSIGNKLKFEMTGENNSIIVRNFK